MRIGSLCTGIGGLELGLHYAGIETKPVFVSDIDPNVCDWLDQAMPYTPNIGDFTQLKELPECDILAAGFPCQPVSQAGLRQGIHDERWLFDDICRLVSRMDSRPVLFLENVTGILTCNDGDAMGRVVYGLADIGYYITWGTLPASAVGAPHRRNRWWGIAYPADTENIGHERAGAPRRRGHGSANSSDPAANTDSSPGPQRDLRQAAGRSVQHGHDTERRSMGTLGQNPAAAANPPVEGPQRRQTEPEHPDELVSRARDMGTRFGRWAPAVARWEHILGRPAPDPHIEGRLNPAFVEHMMGFPEGWVTDIMTKRTHSLKALGNGVVPQCAAEAFRQLTK